MSAGKEAALAPATPTARALRSRFEGFLEDAKTIKITGPIHGGTHGWPYAAAIVDLADQGYIEEEYFFEGAAPSYRPVGDFGIDGRWTAERAGETVFKTRAVVRRPRDPAASTALS